jgi:hypothetical protein
MKIQPQQLVLYLEQDGSCPLELWLENLRDRQARVRIKKRLDRIESGNLGDFKPVGDGRYGTQDWLRTRLPDLLRSGRIDHRTSSNSNDGKLLPGTDLGKTPRTTRDRFIPK